MCPDDSAWAQRKNAPSPGSRGRLRCPRRPPGPPACLSLFLHAVSLLYLGGDIVYFLPGSCAPRSFACEIPMTMSRSLVMVFKSTHCPWPRAWRWVLFPASIPPPSIAALVPVPIQPRRTKPEPYKSPPYHPEARALPKRLHTTLDRRRKLGEASASLTCLNSRGSQCNSPAFIRLLAQTRAIASPLSQAPSPCSPP